MPTQIILEKKGSSIPPQQKKTAVVVIGRFQGIHKGHNKIFDAAKKAFRKYKYDAIVLCVIDGKETSKNKKKNPLSAKSRIFYLEHSIHTKGIKLTVAKNVFDAFIKCRDLGYEPMCVVGGKFTSGKTEENRAHSYRLILDKYFTTPDGEPIKHREVVLERDPEAPGTKGISASSLRAAVLADRYEDFKDMVELDKTDLVQKMFDEIKKNLGDSNGK